jgi:hypothetical protein
MFSEANKSTCFNFCFEAFVQVRQSFLLFLSSATRTIFYFLQQLLQVFPED